MYNTAITTLCVTIATVVIFTEIKTTYGAVTCTNEDTSGIIKNGLTCSEIVTSDNAECYNTTFETTCCSSCNSVATNNQNCLYGDSSTSCFAFLCSSYTDPFPCCGTCGISVATTSSSPVVTSSLSTPVITTLSTLASSTTVPNTTGSSPSGSNGGLIAGLIIGCVVIVTVLVASAYFAVKLLKKKENKVDDEMISMSSRGIPEKRDRHPSSIQENLDICNVLQEKLDTDSVIQENTECITCNGISDPLKVSHTIAIVPSHNNPNSMVDSNEHDKEIAKPSVLNGLNEDNSSELTEQRQTKTTVIKSNVPNKSVEKDKISLNAPLDANQMQSFTNAGIFAKKPNSPTLQEPHGIVNMDEKIPPICSTVSDHIDTCVSQDDNSEATLSDLKNENGIHGSIVNSGSSVTSSKRHRSGNRNLKSNFVFPNFM